MRCVCLCVGCGGKTESIATGKDSVSLLEESSRQSFGCVAAWAGGLRELIVHDRLSIFLWDSACHRV